MYPDWIVTVAFYVALHAVDCLLSFDKVDGVRSHETRNRVLMRTNRYREINRHYLPLHDLSRTVRYLAKPTEWVPLDQIERNVFGRYLYPIEKSVQKLTSVDLQLEKIVLLPQFPS